MPLAHRLFQLSPRDFALGDNALVEQHHRHAPIVEAVQTVVGVDVGKLGFVAKRPEMGESFIAEATALARDQDQPHGRLARQPEGLPHLDTRPMQAIGLLDVLDTVPNIIRRIVLDRDRPQRVPRLHHYRGVSGLAAASSPKSEPDSDQENCGDCRQQSPHRPSSAAGSGCPPRIDSDTGGVHTFGTIANARSRVKASNKGLR